MGCVWMLYIYWIDSMFFYENHALDHALVTMHELSPCTATLNIHSQILPYCVSSSIIFPRNVSFREYYVFVSNAAAAWSAASLFIQISRTSSIIDIVIPSKMAAGGHFVQNLKTLLRSVWIWNGQKCHRKWISDIQNGRSIRNGQKCNRKWFSDIQNGRRKKLILYRSEMTKLAIESEFQTSKMADRSEMARNAIKGDFRTSKMSDGGHFVQIKFRIDLKWPEMRSKDVNIRTSKMVDGGHFVKKLKKIKFRIDLKWPKIRSKMNFRHPNGRRQPFCKKIQKKIKLRIDLKCPEMRSKMNFGYPKWAPAAIL